MEKQEIFDKAVKGILAQGAYAYDYDNHDCMYCDLEGNKCALGLLAKDDEQAEEWESNCLTPTEIGRALGIEDTGTLKFMEFLQAEHDDIAKESNAEFIKSEFIDAMRYVAEKHSLDFPEISG